VRRSDPRPSDPVGVLPTLIRQRPSQREAVRVANGARPRVELANAIAMLVACVIPALSLFAIAVRGCL
jgi:hypothetical protein